MHGAISLGSDREMKTFFQGSTCLEKFAIRTNNHLI
jgi:hypothetical protein